MKVLITGSRENANNAATRTRIKNALSELEQILTVEELNEGTELEYLSHETTTEIWHGGAKGTDQAAKELAQEMGMPEHEIKPDYKNHYFKTAPLERNKELVKNADYILALYGRKGKTGGTAHTVSEAQKQGKGTLENYTTGESRWTPAKSLLF